MTLRSGQIAGDSGARHPHASPHLGRAFSARGHTEREESGVKGRQDPRPRARRENPRRAGREALKHRACARRTMIPKIVIPQFERGRPRMSECRTPSTFPTARSPGGHGQSTCSAGRMRASGAGFPPRTQNGGPLRGADRRRRLWTRPTRCRPPCRRCCGSRRSCRQHPARSSSRSRRRRRGPCR